MMGTSIGEVPFMDGIKIYTQLQALPITFCFLLLYSFDQFILAIPFFHIYVLGTVFK